MDNFADIGSQVVEHVRREMQIDDEWTVSEPSGFTWWGYRLAQRVWAQPCVAINGIGIVLVQSETDLLVDVPDTPHTQECIAVLNSTAALNALVWRPAERRLTLRCSATIHSEVQSWMNKVLRSAVATQLAEAEARVEVLHRKLGGQINLTKHPTSGLRNSPDEMLNVLEVFRVSGKKPSPYSGQEMLRLKEYLDLDTFANGDENAITAELNFSGATPPTVLLRVRTDTPHPTYGNGALITLSLPTLPKEGISSADLPAALNLAELGQLESGYGFGGWCRDVNFPLTEVTTHVMFVPALMFMPGLLKALVLSLRRKVDWVHLFLGLSDNNTDAAAWDKVRLEVLQRISRGAKS